MKELLDKLSSYNLFNYLLPGTIFAAVAKKVAGFDFSQNEIVVDLFIYYFVGLVVSRVGSLLLAPLFEKTGFVEKRPYPDFIAANKADQKIDVLGEQNNMLRTLCALFLLLPLFDVLVTMAKSKDVRPVSVAYIASLALMVLFAFAFRKQTSFIVQRIDNHKAREVLATQPVPDNLPPEA